MMPNEVAVRLAAITILSKLVSVIVITPEGVISFSWNQEDRLSIATMIRSIAQLGDSPPWLFTIEEWARLVEESETPEDAEYIFWGGRTIAMKNAF
jgi:hypothetical protein